MSWLDEMHDVQESMNGVQDELHSLAYSLADIGLEKLAKQLAAMGRILFQAEEKLQQAKSNKVHEDYKQAEQSSVNVLSATLGGIELAARAIEGENKTKPEID